MGGRRSGLRGCVIPFSLLLPRAQLFYRSSRNKHTLLSPLREEEEEEEEEEAAESLFRADAVN